MKVRYWFEGVMIALILVGLNFFNKAIHPHLSAQSALSQFDNSAYSQVNVVGYEMLSSAVNVIVFAVVVGAIAVEVYHLVKENKNEVS